MVITLIGFRGVGKSSVGPQLAARLGWDGVDADVEIARRAGKSIPRIFDEDGEPAFRRLEAEVLADLLHRDRLVVSAGGGAVMNPTTRELMRAAGPIIWLRASVETIWERIGSSLARGGGRPQLTDRDPRAEVELLVQQREPTYRAVATLTVSTDGRSVTAIVDEIMALLPAQPEWPE